MKKDIQPPVVENIVVAIVKETNEFLETVHNVYIVNLRKEAIEGVLVSSKGYGELNGEIRRTSTLRHFLDVVPANSFTKIEPIMDNLFGLSNEYWVSFYVNKVMYDKKYIFLPESIKDSNMVNIPLINKRGVMIR
jgi:hypothetical protein